MEEYTCMIQRETLDGAFYRAVFALHQNNFTRASSVSVSSSCCFLYAQNCFLAMVYRESHLVSQRFMQILFDPAM